MLVGADENKHGYGQVHLLAVEQDHAPVDHPLRLEPLDPAPAGTRRQADAVGDLLHLKGGVLLQQLQNLDVEVIEH